MTDKQKHIAQKILKVAGDIGSIKKSGFNAHQKYHYPTEKDINDAVKPALEKHGVAHYWSVVDTELLKDGQFAVAYTEHTFTDTDSGESITLKAIGTGADKGDKALYKAYTGAAKYIFSKMFLIDTDDDPEKDAGEVVTAGSKKPTTGMMNKPKPKKTTGSAFGSSSTKKSSFGASKKVETKPEIVEEDVEF